jgi:hypothetical protein
MKAKTTFCVVTLLVVALSIASAGAFACQIDCAVSPAPPPISHADVCGGQTHAPSHNSGGHQHRGHTHSRIIAAAHSGFQQINLQQAGLLLHTASNIPAFAGANRAHGNHVVTAKSSSPNFTAPVLRV